LTLVRPDEDVTATGGLDMFDEPTPGGCETDDTSIDFRAGFID
jgi:hypothetical protein